MLNTISPKSEGLGNISVITPCEFEVHNTRCGRTSEPLLSLYRERAGGGAMPDQMTEREAALAARIKELEDAQAKNLTRVTEGGAFEAAWRKITDIVPPWLAAAAMAVLIAHYGFGYYLQSQITATETQLKQAKADVADAEARAANAPVDGVPARLAALKAQNEKNMAEAAMARVTANALRAQVSGETAALVSAKAQLDNAQNQARVAEAKAEAESARFGLSTLADREKLAKLKIQQSEIIKQRVSAAESTAGTDMHDVFGMGYSTRVMIAGLRAYCEDNDFAQEIGCPPQFTRRRSEQSSVLQLAAAPTDSDGNFWKPSQSCAQNLRAFQNYKSSALHGAFAVTRIAKGGGCGWSSQSNGKPMEIMRREALTQCARYGADCKVISER
jgi:hypothetical protein